VATAHAPRLLVRRGVRRVRGRSPSPARRRAGATARRRTVGRRRMSCRARRRATHGGAPAHELPRTTAQPPDGAAARRRDRTTAAATATPLHRSPWADCPFRPRVV